MVLLPFDLHVLGTPPALILSQDQTLQKFIVFVFFSFNLFRSFLLTFYYSELRLFIRYVSSRHI